MVPGGQDDSILVPVSPCPKHPRPAAVCTRRHTGTLWRGTGTLRHPAATAWQHAMTLCVSHFNSQVKPVWKALTTHMMLSEGDRGALVPQQLSARWGGRTLLCSHFPPGAIWFLRGVRYLGCTPRPIALQTFWHPSIGCF